MDSTDLARRIREYDPLVFPELGALRLRDELEFENLIWGLVVEVDFTSHTDIPPVLLRMLYEALGADHMDRKIYLAWPEMQQIGKENICYAASIPDSLSSETAISLFLSPYSTVADRHLIASGLTMSAGQRNITEVLFWLLPRIGEYASPQQQEMLKQFLNNCERTLRH